MDTIPTPTVGYHGTLSLSEREPSVSFAIAEADCASAKRMLLAIFKGSEPRILGPLGPCDLRALELPPRHFLVK